MAAAARPPARSRGPPARSRGPPAHPPAPTPAAPEGGYERQQAVVACLRRHCVQQKGEAAVGVQIKVAWRRGGYQGPCGRVLQVRSRVTGGPVKDAAAAWPPAHRSAPASRPGRQARKRPTRARRRPPTAASAAWHSPRCGGGAVMVVAGGRGGCRRGVGRGSKAGQAAAGS